MSVLAVTVATDSPELLSHATAVFRTWRERLTALLHQGGLRGDDIRSVEVQAWLNGPPQPRFDALASADPQRPV
jgi:hypothetical protein